MKKLSLILFIFLTFLLPKAVFAEEFFEWFNSFSNSVEIHAWDLPASSNIEDGVLRLTSSDNWCSTKRTFPLPKMEIKAVLKFKEGDGAFQVALGSGNEMIWSLSFDKNNALKGAIWKSQILIANNSSARPMIEYNADDISFDQWMPLSIIKRPKGFEIWLNYKLLEKINLSPPEMPVAFRKTGLLQVECDEIEVRPLSSEAGNLDDSSLEKGLAISNGWTQLSGVWSTVLMPKTNTLAICQSMDTNAELVLVDELTEGSSISAQVRFDHKGQVGLGLRNEKTEQGLRVLIRQNDSNGLVGEFVNAGVASMSFRSPVQIFPGLWYQLNLHCRRGRVAIELNGKLMGEMESKQYGRPSLLSDGASSALFREVKISGRKGVNTISTPLISLDNFIKSTMSMPELALSAKKMDGFPLDIGKPMFLPILLIEESKLIWKMSYFDKGGFLNVHGLDENRKKIFTSILDFTKDESKTEDDESPSLQRVEKKKSGAPSQPVAKTKLMSIRDIALQRIGQDLLITVDRKTIDQINLPNDGGPISIELEPTEAEMNLTALNYGWMNAQKVHFWDESKYKTATNYWRMKLPRFSKEMNNNHTVRGPLGTVTLRDQLGLNHRIFLHSRDALHLPSARRHVVEWSSDDQTMSVSIILLDDGCEVQWNYNDRVIGRQRLKTLQIQLLAGFDAQNKFRVWISGQPLGEALDVGSRLWKFALRPETEGSEQYWQQVLWYNR